MKQVDIRLITNILGRMKNEANKRSKIYKYGVDLANYENGYLESLIDLVSHILHDKKEEIEWWLFEDVKKQYFIKDLIFDVEKPKDFVNFLLSDKI